tara:strand:- start:448 stop:1068 length:621 start_codon:yes stop_codon:yes gene_type:complete
MKIEQIELKKIKPYFNNPRKISIDAVEKVKKSIEEFGFQQPIVVDKDMVIIVGHTRYKASKLLNLEKVPTVIADIPKDKVKSYRIADNRTNESSEWDLPLLNKEFLDLLDLKVDLSLTGFDENEFLKIMKDHKDDENIDFPEIEDIEKRDFEEITFTFSLEQGAIVKEQLEYVKKNIDIDDETNTNKNANAMFHIIKTFSDSISKK